MVSPSKSRLRLVDFIIMVKILEMPMSREEEDTNEEDGCVEKSDDIRWLCGVIVVLCSECTSKN